MPQTFRRLRKFSSSSSFSLSSSIGPFYDYEDADDDEDDLAAALLPCVKALFQHTHDCKGSALAVVSLKK